DISVPTRLGRRTDRPLVRAVRKWFASAVGPAPRCTTSSASRPAAQGLRRQSRPRARLDLTSMAGDRHRVGPQRGDSFDRRRGGWGARLVGGCRHGGYPWVVYMHHLPGIPPGGTLLEVPNTPPRYPRRTSDPTGRTPSMSEHGETSSVGAPGYVASKDAHLRR